MENVGDTGAAYSMVLVDRFVVTYPRVLVAGAGWLEGSWSLSGTAEVSGTGEGAHILDTTDEPVWLNGAQAGFRAEANHSYLIVAPDAALQPEVKPLVSSTLKSTRHQADYLMVGPRAMLEAAQPLVDWRVEQGLEVMAVPVEELYQEFANQVPSPTVKTSFMWTVSDPSYVAVNGEDALPDLAIGRLPAATADEVRVMMGKILAYESREATMSGKAVLVADNPDRAGDFEADAEDIATNLLATRDTTKIYLGQLGAQDTHDAIVGAFDQGASIVSYMGHGGIDLWADEKIFKNSHVNGLASQSQQPLLLTLNCLNGYFIFPHFNSLSEELLKAEGKGVIAAFSPSGLSLDEPAHLFHKVLLSEILSGAHQRLGDAVLAAQGAYADSGAFPELLSIYHLFGDPAMEIR